MSLDHLEADPPLPDSYYPHPDLVQQLREDLPAALQELLTRLESKDLYTYQRSIRAADLARRVGIDACVSGRRLAALGVAALLHDLGKLALPDEILKSTGALSDEQMAVMREHPSAGEAYLLENAPELELAAHFVRWHHERYDGLGYPDGLPGDAIPLEARILSVVDAYAAMTSHCYYHGVLSTEDAIAVLRERAGTQWEPRCVALLVHEVTAST
jgi:HD-GYP domain-containing protein (c-di-GMP phosphodiesterase class II)